MVREPCRVLVTGAGSGVGQGIIKALRISKLPVTVVSADISTMNSALYRTDESILIPRVESEGALDQIIELLCFNKIDVVMIGSEFDMEFFSENKEYIERISGVLVIVSQLETFMMADDKWLTTEFLRENRLPYAEAYLPQGYADAERIAKKWGYPVVLKTRRGTSSRHVHIINDRAELLEHYSSIPLPMLQRVIDIPSQQLSSEFTCSVFKTADGNMIGPFTARRTVRGGTSWFIEIAQFKVLRTTLLEIADKIDFIGSLNVQLMLTTQGAIPFELNARFSGTTAVRAHYGFNEPAMALLSFFYKEEVPVPKVRAGIAMRYHEEVFIENESANSLLPSHKGAVNSWF